MEVHEIAFEALRGDGGATLEGREDSTLGLGNAEVDGLERIGRQGCVNGVKQRLQPLASQCRNRDRSWPLQFGLES